MNKIIAGMVALNFSALVLTWFVLFKLADRIEQIVSALEDDSEGFHHDA